MGYSLEELRSGNMRKNRILVIFIEASVITATIFIWDVVGNHLAFYNYIFNPYWIPVFIVSARWGVLSFLITILEYAAVSILSIQIQGFSVNILAFSMPLALGALFGVILALIGESLRRNIERMRYTIEEKEKIIRQQKDDIAKMKMTLERLKENIFLEGSGLSLIFQRLRELETFDTEEKISNAVDIISDIFKVKSLSIYKRNGNFLRFVVGKGERFLPNSVHIKDSLVIKRAVEKGMATITDILLSDDIQGYEPWLAVLIGDSTKNYGVLIVEDIDKLSESFAEYMRSIAQWFYIDLENAEKISSPGILEHRKPDNTWDIEYYKHSRKIFKDRYDKFKIPFSEICLFITPSVYQSVVGEFRNDDVVTILEKTKKGVKVKVLLSVCDESAKKVVIKRLTSKYGEKVTLCNIN